MELLDLLELEQLDEDLYRGRQPRTSMQRVFGGQVAAQALRAACATVGDGLSVHSLHAYFLLPGDTAIPIVYDVERIRDGRSFCTRRVAARQHGKSIFYLTASFQVAEDGLDHQDAMPDVPSPEQCPDLGAVIGSTMAPERLAEWQAEWGALDVRYAADSRPGGRLVGQDQPARAHIWIRVRGDVGDDPVVNACLSAYVSDLTLLGVSLVPHGLTLMSPDVQAASLDHSMWFHRPFRADAWLLYDQNSPSASGARALTTGRLFTRDGRLAASVAQEGLIRRVARRS